MVLRSSHKNTKIPNNFIILNSCPDIERNPQQEIEFVRIILFFKTFPLGNRFLTDPTVSPEQRASLRDPETRRLFNIKTDPDIRDTLDGFLAQVGAPVRVVFNTSVCLDCSVEGDSRLLPRHCHMEPQDVHPGQVERHHPGDLQSYHPTQHHILQHPGRLKRSWYSNILCGTWRRPRYSCCQRREGKAGCDRVWACCRQSKDLGTSAGCSRTLGVYSSN